jgi:opacity protein-like surface antigen
MPYRNTLFYAAAAFALIGASPAFAQIAAGDIYVRADLGISGATNGNFHNRNQPVVNPLNTVTGITGTLSDLGSGWVAGIGGGLHILPNVRADLVYTYRGSFSLDEGDQAVPPNRFQANVSSNSVMATGYWDFPLVGQTSAYLGLGLGWADVSMSNLSSNTGALTVNPHIAGANGIPIAPGGRSDNFAWQVTTGIAFPVANNVLLEIFYRYFDAGHVQTPAGNVTVNGSVVGQYGGAEGALHAHELAVSLRVPLK